MEHSQHEFAYRLGFGRAWLAAVGAWVALLTATVGAVAQLPGAPAAGQSRIADEVTVPPQPTGADQSAVPADVRELVVPTGASGPEQPVDASVPAESTPASSTPAETRKEPERSGKPLRRRRIRDGGPTDYLQPRIRTLPA